RTTPSPTTPRSSPRAGPPSCGARPRPTWPTRGPCPVADARAAPPTPPDAGLGPAQQRRAAGLAGGPPGHRSGRLPHGPVRLPAASVADDTMTLEDLVIVDMDRAVVEGTRSPTTEKDLHLAASRLYPELGAVIHTHAVHATMFALAHEPIPAVIEE